MKRKAASSHASTSVCVSLIVCACVYKTASDDEQKTKSSLIALSSYSHLCWSEIHPAHELNLFGQSTLLPQRSVSRRLLHSSRLAVGTCCGSSCFGWVIAGSAIERRTLLATEKHGCNELSKTRRRLSTTHAVQLGCISERPGNNRCNKRLLELRKWSEQCTVAPVQWNNDSR